MSSNRDRDIRFFLSECRARGLTVAEKNKRKDGYDLDVCGLRVCLSGSRKPYMLGKRMVYHLNFTRAKQASDVCVGLVRMPHLVCIIVPADVVSDSGSIHIPQDFINSRSVYKKYMDAWWVFTKGAEQGTGQGQRIERFKIHAPLSSDGVWVEEDAASPLRLRHISLEVIRSAWGKLLRIKHQTNRGSLFDKDGRQFTADNAFALISTKSPCVGEKCLYVRGDINDKDNTILAVPSDEWLDMCREAVREYNAKYRYVANNPEAETIE